VLSGIGGFGGLFDARFKGYKSPVLVSSVDGVGTKLVVAQMMKRHDTVGQDLVNHCVNDILVCGARPLFFMDYRATGKLNFETTSDIIGGFVQACKENGCSLIGGETAEMPGFYDGDKYDLAGTIVGVVEKKKIIDSGRTKKGDVLIGLSSTGLHTNGYSLARSTLLRKYSVNDFVEELGSTVGEVLLTVHRSYLKIVSEVVRKFDVRGLSHVTGGGIIGNTMRVLPKALALSIDWNSWDRPRVFRLIQSIGNIPEEDMRRTFNLGIGFVVIVPKKSAKAVLKTLRKRGENGRVIGEVVGGKE
jgi:phosphoribosylformylglycinamidine cyclo-ligase